jgi:hypothetical protein
VTSSKLQLQTKVPKAICRAVGRGWADESYTKLQRSEAILLF